MTRKQMCPKSVKRHQGMTKEWNLIILPNPRQHNRTKSFILLDNGGRLWIAGVSLLNINVWVGKLGGKQYAANMLKW